MLEERFYVNIHCTMFSDTFSTEMFDRFTTGDEVFAFLVKDSGNAFNSAGVRIPGDHNLWYLGCTDKKGHLVYKKESIAWGYGESSFDHVEEFVRLIRRDRNFSENQFHILMELIEEGRGFDCLYDIPRYLITRRRKHPWTKTPESETFRNRMKELSRQVKLSSKSARYPLSVA